jgi:hypothetical protein
MKTYQRILFLSCMAFHLQATLPKRTLFVQTRQPELVQPELVELNTIVVEQKEPNSPFTLGLRKILIEKPENKKNYKKTSSQEKEAFCQKSQAAKKQSLSRVEQWVESRKTNPIAKKQTFPAN